LVAEERLKNDANARSPAAKKGIFVDPFFNDNMRDLGIEQTAAIVDRCLELPISATVHDTGKAENPWMLPFTLEPLINQPLRTGSMKINPYQAFDPLPAIVKMVLDTDRWTEVQTVWNSSTTRRFSSAAVSNLGTGDLVSSRTTEASTMRSIPQKFIVDGFKPNERLTVIFDGITVEARNVGGVDAISR